MPIYEIEQYELHAKTYRVKAESPADAIVNILDGEGLMEDESEYIEVFEEYGMLTKNHPELAEALRKLDVSLGEHIIPSIRSIHEIAPDQEPSKV